MYDIHLVIDQDTPEGRVIDQVVQSQHLSPGEAVRSVLRHRAAKTPAEAMLGSFSSPEDESIIDAAMELARERRKADHPRDFGL